MYESIDKNLMLVSTFAIIAILTMTYSFSATPSGFALYEPLEGHRDLETIRGGVESQMELYDSIQERELRTKNFIPRRDDLVQEVSTGSGNNAMVFRKCVEKFSYLENVEDYCDCRVEDKSKDCAILIKDGN